MAIYFSRCLCALAGSPTGHSPVLNLSKSGGGGGGSAGEQSGSEAGGHTGPEDDDDDDNVSDVDEEDDKEHGKQNLFVSHSKNQTKKFVVREFNVS